MVISIVEHRIWFIISFILFTIAFVDRAGRPLMFFGIIFLVIGIVSMLEHEWKESQEHREVEKRSQMQRMSEMAKEIEKRNVKKNIKGR
jgi:predicted membrane protein